LGGVKNLAIIHGAGEGRLRKAVRGYLKGDARVLDFHGANQSRDGVTVVTLDV
jgi:dsDNA-specific endonuclease/ATPase MutS2